ncbi:ABC transporter permease [Conexibacter sp. JD483]|uniref:ABC transporter permease n=1 Tax=unclassified Conexibacter TaxID=2627773 RepID=UPI002718577A|nr:MULTISPECIES: ABC transporter permease [unclassified Conexibacter]MDO8187302.1 ABC transporter permease [Conexibacter sp. CPCC 205706]MDO8198911.1 ABC transporter permease [Conexibacter sp. CPCC 205762]MDR9370650.1 ABC transporter permease [Conexibacter sp. JD483]
MIVQRLRDDRSLLINGSFVVAFVVLLIVAATTTDSFMTDDNITNLMKQSVTTGLLALGMLMVILTGGIDLSVGSVVALAGIMAAGLSADLPIPLAMAIGVAAGVACGFVNGMLVARFRLAPFVVTLAALTTIRGLAYVYSETPVTPTDIGFLWIGTESIGPFPVATLIVVAVFALAWVFLTRTGAGRAIIAIGGNREAVRLAGVNVPRHILVTYMISGFLAGLAGVILASRVGIAQPSVGVAFELNAIAACVIGGASLAGGRGSVLGTLGGVVLLALIDNLLTLYDVQSYWQQVLKGLIIVAVVLARRTEDER